MATPAAARASSRQGAVRLPVRGRVADADSLPLPGATVTLVAMSGRGAQPPPAATGVTGADGAYELSVPPGRYQLHAELSGFRDARVDVVVATSAVTVDLTLALAAFSAQVTVTGEAPQTIVGATAPDAPVVVTREVVDSAMLPNSQYDDVLPLMPNVVRGPDGLISVAGARAPQGALVVNGLNETDPVTGAATLMLPLESVDTLKVYEGGYPAAFGRATGGVTTVVTRSGADAFHASANSFFPRLLFADGGIRGVEYWEPNAGASGPIVRGRAYFEQGLSDRLDRNRFTTLAGPQHNEYDALMSWTQIDIQPSATHHLIASMSADPQRTDRAGITAFTTSGSAPRLDQGGWSAALSDRATLGTRGTLDVRASVVQTRTMTMPNGAGAYAVGHDATLGSYFDAQDLRGRRAEAAAVATVEAARGHVLTAGVTAGLSTIAGDDRSSRVDLLRSDGTIARSIAFAAGDERVDARTTDASGFVQDAWTPAPWLTVDGGLRFDRVAVAAAPVWSPRTAFTVKPGDRATTISASAGVFADKIVLGALAFPSLPARIVTTYDADGLPAAPPIALRDVMGASLRLPQAFRWDVQLDRMLGAAWTARVRYAERHGDHELIVAPLRLAADQGVLSLDSGGSSVGRSLEATVGYRSGAGGQQVYVSYVRASTRGSLNSFDAIDGVFKDPFVQPDQVGPLTADVPHRLLAWGVLRGPSRLTIAPFLEARSGFPYSAIDDAWAYVGARNAYRLPWFASLDLYVNKVVDLPGRLPNARVGLKLYNVASIHTGRDVQRDIDRADFGTTYNPIPRDFTFVFELLWGKR